MLVSLSGICIWIWLLFFSTPTMLFSHMTVAKFFLFLTTFIQINVSGRIYTFLYEVFFFVQRYMVRSVSFGFFYLITIFHSNFLLSYNKQKKIFFQKNDIHIYDMHIFIAYMLNMSIV